MATYDLGDVVALAVTIRDAAGDPANPTALTATVTTPDGVTAAVATAHPSVGLFTLSYTPTAVGLHGVRWVATGANAASFRDSFTVLPDAIPIVSLADAKDRLNLTTTDHDEELRRIIAAASGRAEQYTGRALSVRTLTQSKDLTDRPSSLCVVDIPTLLTVTDVTLDGVDVAGYAVVAGGQALLRSGGEDWAGVVSITGTVGVSGGDLAVAQQAVLELVAHLWETQRAPVGRNPQPATGMGYALPNRVAEMLDGLVLPGGFG